MKHTRLFIFAAASLTLLLTMVWWGGSPAAEPLAAWAVDHDDADLDEALPVVGSYDRLKQLLKEREQTNRLNQYAAMEDAASAPAAGAPASGKSSIARDYSKTNVQVDGVDEADRVKTDGTYLYQVGDRQIRIIRAYPAKQMDVVHTLSYTDRPFTPQELYVDDRHMVVIGWEHQDMAYPDGREIAPMIARKIAPVPMHGAVTAIIYDIRDKANIRKVREISLEGQYVSSRKIGSALYLVANRYADVYRIMNEKKEVPAPAYRDSAWGEDAPWKPHSYEDIRYFPDFQEPNYLQVAGVDLDRPQQPIDVSAYLGAGQHIYASSDHLYTAVTGYKADEVRPLVMGDTVIWPGRPADTHTRIYKFRLKDGQITYAARGEVPGTVLNQFSMDEHNGHFRIATTKGDMWRNDEYTSKNNVYILDANLKRAGQLEDIAPGERIYSARFMGDRAYMVTFKKVDPLFVIDLKDPRQPKILGALKIPGYSDYLHPYDEHHVIGFGKDTVEGKWPGAGPADDTVAFYQGMKVALFDVTDVTQPKEKFKEIIGGRGTESELLHNHKALLFSHDKQLLAFPVTVRETTPSEASDVTAYGRFTFQGAYIYQLDLQNGFTLKGKITHLSADDHARAGDGWYESDRNVQRILYIEDTLYTLSPSMIKAHSWPALQEVRTLDLRR